jgi:hypothetical protein
VLRSHARALEDWTGRPRPLELGDDEPPDELEATDRALCCSSIPFGAVALKVRFCPSGLALLRRELRLARVLLPESRTRLRTHAVRACSLGLWAAFRSIDLNGRASPSSRAADRPLPRARVLLRKLDRSLYCAVQRHFLEAIVQNDAGIVGSGQRSSVLFRTTPRR